MTYKLFPGLEMRSNSWLLERLLLDIGTDLDLDRRLLTGEVESLDLDTDLDLERRPLMGDTESRGEGDFCLLLYGIFTGAANRNRRDRVRMP